MQVRSPLRISAGSNQAYAPLLRQQFCRNNRKQFLNNKTSSHSNFRRTKAKGVVGF